MTSTRAMTGTGLKKCMPTTRSSQPLAEAAMAVTLMLLVLVARPTLARSGEGSSLARAAKISSLTAWSSTTASTTQSTSPSASSDCS